MPKPEHNILSLLSGLTYKGHVVLMHRVLIATDSTMTEKWR